MVGNLTGAKGKKWRYKQPSRRACRQGWVSNCADGHPALAEINATSGHGPWVYERHDSASQALHRVVRDNLATFYAAIEQGWESGLPEFVRAEFSRYLDCSVLERGFAHLSCESCGEHHVVAFSCKARTVQSANRHSD